MSVSWCLSSDMEPPQRPKRFNIYLMKTSPPSFSHLLCSRLLVAVTVSRLCCRLRKLHFRSCEKSVFQHTRFVLLRPKDPCRSAGTKLPCCVSGFLILVHPKSTLPAIVPQPQARSVVVRPLFVPQTHTQRKLPLVTEAVIHTESCTGADIAEQLCVCV